MWRALFQALGLYACLLGAECMAIDKAVLAPPHHLSVIESLNPPRREFVPTDWEPWSLLSAGAVTILYSFTIPKRLHKT
jgi:hypothetical protein